jgi:hypothetical protein
MNLVVRDKTLCPLLAETCRSEVDMFTAAKDCFWPIANFGKAYLRVHGLYLSPATGWVSKRSPNPAISGRPLPIAARTDGRLSDAL